MQHEEYLDYLAYQARQSPDNLALSFEGETWSFAELDRWASAVADQLLDLGLESGDRIGLLAANSPGYVFLIHGAMRAGVTLVPLNTRLTVIEIQQQVERAQIQLLIYDRKFDMQATDVAARKDGLRVQRLLELVETTDDHLDRVQKHPIPADQLQNIIFTSGTTGQPKGALLTYGNFVNNALASANHLGHHESDRWLLAMPLFHVGGLAILMRSVVCGFAVELHNRFDPRFVNDRINSGQVTIISVVSTMLQRMLDACDETSYPESLRTVLLGGGPAPRTLVEECVRRGIPVAPSYGMTETCSQVATLLPAEAACKPRSSGRPLPGVEFRIDSQVNQPATGGAGEILVRGPVVINHYLDGDGAASFEDSWFRTGDIGWLDEDGYLYVLDRRDDLIISGGENIYPAEVEAVLVEHPAVVEAAVVPREDADWGQVPVAFLVLADGVEVANMDLNEYCRSRLASYRTPRDFVVVDELPRNSGGKILRRLLAHS